jgi:hypothetical protein
VKETLEYREKNNIERKDFLNLLIQLKKKIDINEIDDEEDKNVDDDLENIDTEENFSFEEHSKTMNKTVTKNGVAHTKTGHMTRENGHATAQNHHVTPKRKWLDSVGK